MIYITLVYSVQMARWLSSVSLKMCHSARSGSNPVWAKFSIIFSPTSFYYKFIPAKGFRDILTMLGYYME